MRATMGTVAAALAAVVLGTTVQADDPACVVRASTARVMFADHGPVNFGPGFTGSVGSDTLGLRYNFLLMGDYDWWMNGRLDIHWPPALRVGATGDPMGGHLTLQYGLRLQFWFRILGTEVMIPVPVEVGVDRSEIGMRTFTPWAWDGMDSAVTVTAHERLLHTDSVSVLGHTVDYDIYGAYELTTSVATHDISFPQARTRITVTTPEADVSPTANGDIALPARWEGALRYVGSLQLRVVLRFRDMICLPGLPLCVSGTQTLTPPALPFASATEQQISVDRSVHVPLPGFLAPATADFGSVPLGLTGRQVLTLQNPGTVTTLVTLTAPTDRHFTVAVDPMCITGGASRPLSVRFIPDAPGHFESDLVLTASDPSVPMVTVHLTADAVDPGDPLAGHDGGVDGETTVSNAPDGGAMGADGGAAMDGAGGLVLDSGGAGCGCRAGSPVQPRHGAGMTHMAGLMVAAMVSLRAVYKRRRRR